jgi:hypothetical protein
MVIQEKCILISFFQTMLEKNKTVNSRWFKEVLKLEIINFGFRALSVAYENLFFYLMIFEEKSIITEKKVTKIFISTQQVLLK